MKFSQLQLRTSLMIVVLLLTALTLAAVGVNWQEQQRTRADLSALVAGGVPGGADAGGKHALEAAQRIDARLAQARYVSAGLAALALLLALLACVIMSRAVLRPLKRVGVYFEHIAAGDLTHRIEVSAQNEIGALYAALKRMQDSLARIVGAVRLGMEEIHSGAQRIAAGSTDLSSRTGQQAAALQQTAASMEQLASTVKQNADNARQANQLAATASEVAHRGGQAVDEVVSTMEGISASSRKISDIVGVIDSIAFQTNILALNAAVEAARAGEQGKGFAVVASEVRALAQRSGQAAKEIKDLIEDSVKRVAEGSRQVERAGSTMREIVDSVARVTDIMGEISAATTEQSSGIDQINNAVAQMDLVTQQNATLVQETASSAAGLREQVATVSDAVAVFKTADKQVIDVAARQLPAGAGRPAVAGAAAARKSAAGVAALERPAPASSAAPRAARNPASDAALDSSRPKTPQQTAAARPAADKTPPAAAPSYVMKPAGAKAAGEDEWVEF